MKTKTYISFTYTLSDLQELRSCIKCNSNLSSALFAFELCREWPEGFPWRPYLELAEQIIRDSDFPEKRFTGICAGEFHIETPK